MYTIVLDDGNEYAIVKEEVIESEGSGHSAMAGLLAGLDINAVI